MLLFVVLALSAGCEGGMDIGARPAQDPLVATEAYLQLYQPGPLQRVFQTTRIYDRNGTLLTELWDEGDRRWVALDQISPHLLHATLATEDASFYANAGIDPVRIVGAAWQSFNAGQVVSGASTITMQLARNLFLGADQRYNQSMDRKILEAGVAQELTRQFSKEELLEMYLNLLNYGGLRYGPEAAARAYFGKPAADLNLAEASLLAGIPQQPANLDLFQNFEAAKRRQRIVLNLMVRHGYLTQVGADAVFEQAVTVQAAPNVSHTTRRAPHFVQYVIESLDTQLGAGYTRRAGLSLITTLDLPMQEMAQTLVQTRVAELRPEFDMNNGALVALAPGSAEILTMVGSADFNDATIAGQVNVATSLRQPGSAIKPILFAAALESGLISPASVLWDTPVAYALPTGEVYTPHNYDHTLHGPVTVRHTLANSYNIPAVKLLDRVGVPQLLEFARALGLRSLDREAGWYGLSLAVGGGEVRLLDLTAAFQPLANGGQQLAPRYLLSMTNNRGQQMLETPQPEPPVITPATAFLITDILSDNVARSPAFGANSPLVLSRPAAVKTGTTDDFRDNLTVGYTRHLVTGVWVGNTDGSPTRLSTGITGAAPIWQAFMEAVLADPALLARLGAPPLDEDAGWRFDPPPDVATVAGGEGCPPYVICRDPEEFFSETWLAQWGEQGPLADSVALCGTGESNQARALLLPGAQRLLPAAAADVDPSAEVSAEDNEVTLNDQRQAEQDEALSWSQAHGIAVSPGDCAARVQQAHP